MEESAPIRVILESPYAGGEGPSRLLNWFLRIFPRIKVMLNVRYARACLRDSLLRGEAPIATHLLYTQPGVLNDRVPAEREQGIQAGLAWGHEAEATVVYVDRGISGGMKYGIERARREGREVYYRRLTSASQWARHDIRPTAQSMCECRHPRIQHAANGVCKAPIHYADGDFSYGCGCAKYTCATAGGNEDGNS